MVSEGKYMIFEEKWGYISAVSYFAEPEGIQSAEHIYHDQIRSLVH